MGCFRLILAELVLLSHIGVAFFGFNPGVIAVISFFLLSGYVMAVLIKKHYASPLRVLDFYKDRAARLFPQFLFYSAVTVALIGPLRVSTPSLSQCDARKIALNLAMLPLDFFKFPALGLEHCLLIRQAWSLGLELTFYLIAPAVVLVPKFRKFAIAGSIAVFALAVFGFIDTDIYGYRLLPGVLFIFAVGIALRDRDVAQSKYPLFVWIGSVAMFCLLLSNPQLYALRYSKEVLFGLIVGIPFVWLLTTRRFLGWDEYLGNLSYGVFLNHLLCIWLVEMWLGHEIRKVPQILDVVALSLVLAVATYFLVERPALLWRRTIRYRSRSQAGIAPGLQN